MNIYEKVAAFCKPYFANRSAIYTAESLTTAFIDAQLIDQWPEMPDDMRMACYIGIQQIVRPLARKDAKDDVEDVEKQIDLDLPETELLQDRYSVPAGKDLFGTPVFKYVPRHLLTEADVMAICERDRKLSRHYAKRANALESWFHRNRQQGRRGTGKGDGPRPSA